MAKSMPSLRMRVPAGVVAPQLHPSEDVAEAPGWRVATKAAIIDRLVHSRALRRFASSGTEPSLTSLDHLRCEALLAPVESSGDALVSAILAGKQVLEGIASLPNHVFWHLYRDRTARDQRHHVAREVQIQRTKLGDARRCGPCDQAQTGATGYL